jgi:hypothetical protein
MLMPISAAEEALFLTPVEGFMDTRQPTPCRSTLPREESRFVSVDTSQIAIGKTLTLNLFDDVTYTAINTRVEGRVWYGELTDVEGSSVVLVTDGWRVHGRISANGYRYLISPVSNGVHEVSRFPLSDTGGIALVPTAPRSMQASQARVDDGSRIDILVVYTAGAKSIMERVVGSVDLAIEGAIAQTNQIFEASGITTRLNLVHVAPVFYLEQPNVDFDIDLNNLMGKDDGYLDEVHLLRDQYNADLVAMISGVWFASYTGKAPAPSPLDESKGFSITEACNITDTTFTQQIGFNLGSTHDIANAVNLPPVKPYGYGYQDPEGDFVTVMAKRTGGECPPIVTANQCSVIERFSNPSQTENGKPIGTENANNVRSINELAVTVANYRTSDESVTPTNTPNAPTLILNGGFEIDADKDNVPDFWKGKNLGLDGVNCQAAYEGKCAFVGSPDGKRSATTRVDVSGLNRGDTLTLSAYVSGIAMTEGAELRLIVKYDDGTKDKLRLPIPTENYDFTPISDDLMLSTTKTVVSAKVQIRYFYAFGIFTVDAVNLTSSNALVPLPQ